MPVKIMETFKCPYCGYPISGEKRWGPKVDSMIRHLEQNHLVIPDWKKAMLERRKEG